MGLTEKIAKREPERMPDWHFKLMNVLFHIIDFVYPYIDKRVQQFGIRPNMTVVDYGCGPGRTASDSPGLPAIKVKSLPLIFMSWLSRR